MHEDGWVWDDFTSARAAFLEAAEARGASICSWQLEGHTDLTNTALWCDSAFLGPEDAQCLLLCTSGIHGFEGPAGSAIETTWLRQNHPIPENVAMLVVHALNPWGFANRSRATEDNVDLNRSFVDRSAPLPANPDYALIHPALCPPRVETEDLARARQQIEAFEREYGAARANSAIGKGQYSHPDGLYFGGTREPWSVGVLRDILMGYPARPTVRRAALVDLHTGRGDFGKPFFLCFDPQDSQAFARAARWWGRDAIAIRDELGAKYASDQPPPRTGLAFRGIRAMLAPAVMAGAVVEFGTYDLWTMYEAELMDRWVRFHGTPGAEATERYRERAFRAFTPADPSWRRGVLSSGPPIISAALAGLAAEADISRSSKVIA